MRDEYIQLIKEYVASKPNYKDTIREIKADLLSIGATDKEFQEAIRQLGLPESLIHAFEDDPKSEAQKQPRHGKKVISFARHHLVALDVATHFIILIAISTAMLLYFFSPVAIKYIPFLKGNLGKEASNTNLATVNLEAKDPHLVQKVFATSQEINSKDVFSIKPSNITLTLTGTPKRSVYGFFPYWMLDDEDKVNINALTTLSLFGLEVEGSGGIQTRLADGTVEPGWTMWNNPKVDDLLKRARRKRLTVELTIKAFNNTSTERLVLSDEAQKTFIANAIHLLQLKSLDGLNLDFEYIGTPSLQVKDGFTRLITNLRSEMKRQIPDSTLTLATYIHAAAVPRLVDVQLTAEHVDAFVIMGYDFHTPSGSPGPVAPMEGGESIVGYMQSYLDKVGSDKLILAVPYYGYDWSLTPARDETTRTIPYAQIVEATKNAKISWDSVAQTPFYEYIDPETRAKRVVHFENTRSLGVKFDYVNTKNLKGVGIWALGYDGLHTDLHSLILEKFAK